MRIVNRHRRAVALASLAAASAWVVATAAAQDAGKPVPGCAGVQFTDPAGDQSGGDNLDLTSGFFRTDNGKTTVNLVVKNLTQDIPPAATGVNWYAIWTNADINYFVSAEVDFLGGLAFNYGTYDPNGLGYSTEGETSGKLFEGADGVVQIVVPPEAKGALGQTLSAPYANATTSLALPLIGGLVSTADEAPDGSTGGTDYAVANDCGAGPTGPTGPATPPATKPPAGGATLPVKLASSSVRAKGRKTATFTVRASAAVRNLAARMRKGRTTVATGRRATLTGTKSLKLKARRAIRAGTYVLELTGTTSSGRGSAAFNVRVR